MTGRVLGAISILVGGYIDYFVFINHDVFPLILAAYIPTILLLFFPLILGIASIILGISAYKFGAKLIGVIGIIISIPPTALYPFLSIFFYIIGGSR